MVKGIVLRIIIWIAFIYAISHFFEASYYLAFIIVLVLGLFGEIIHMPENMPGSVDNSDGKELHPYKVLVLATIFVFVFVGLGEAFPELYEYGSK